MHPDSWIPDRNGNCIDDNYAYHIFEQTTTIEQLEATNFRNQGDVYFNLDKITASSFVRDDMKEYSRASRRQLNKLDDKYRNLRIVNYYCTLAGRKYLITFCNMGSLIIRFERIEPTTEQEAKYPELIEFPVVVTNIFPLQDDPFGL